MSQENVELVRRLCEAFQNGFDLDAAAKLWHADIDWRAIEGAPDDIGVFEGHRAMRDYYEQWIETFDDLRLVPEELIDAGDKVVGVLRITGRMKGTDAEVEMTLGVVATVRDGKVIRGREYATREQALEAAGLRE